MRLKPAVYLFGGSALALAAILMVVGVFIQPVATEVPLAAGRVFTWKLSLVFFYLSAAFIITGMLALALHFAGTAQGGWALLGVAAVIPGTVGYLAGYGTEWSYLVTGLAPVEGSALPPPVWGLVAMATAGRIVCWVGLAAEGMAVSGVAAFPRWFGLLGVLIGVLEIVGEVVFSPGTILQLLWLVGFAWMFVLGLLMLQKRAVLAEATAAA